MRAGDDLSVLDHGDQDLPGVAIEKAGHETRAVGVGLAEKVPLFVEPRKKSPHPISSLAAQEQGRVRLFGHRFAQAPQVLVDLPVREAGIGHRGVVHESTGEVEVDDFLGHDVALDQVFDDGRDGGCPRTRARHRGDAGWPPVW